MSLLRRLFKVGESEAHSLVDKLEDPIKMTEQGIRDLKKSLDESLKAFAEVKALAIRSKKEFAENKARARDYESKAMALLQRAERGDMDLAEADRLATQALTKKDEADQQAVRAKGEMERFETTNANLDRKIKELRTKISHFENELKTLRARAKVSKATKSVNKQLANIDSTGTVAMLERMKEKVEQDEALSEAYGEIANESKSVDDEIDAALTSSGGSGSDALAALKAKMANKGTE